MGADDRHGFKTPPHERTWLDDPKTTDRIVWALYAICALLVLVDPFIHKHGYFAIEHVWGYYAVCGFAGCVGLVLAARLMRVILMRPEDYYDE